MRDLGKLATKREKAKNLLPVKILEKVIHDLFHNGKMPVEMICRNLNLSSTQVRKILGPVKDHTFDDTDFTLCDEIMYDANLPVAKETIIQTERSRYEQYALVEEKSLKVMLNLLDYYLQVPAGESFEIDQFTSNMASTFIKTTQQVRDELLKKYAIDMQALKENDENCIRVEFISSPHMAHEG